MLRLINQITLVLLCGGVSVTSLANEVSDLERIEVKGTYVEGYGADEVSGASRLNLAVQDIPQSVSVITSAQMQDFQLTDLNAALDSATGLNVQRIETDRTYYTARGFDISNFQIDGIGLPLVNSNYHASEDTAIFERIEVIRGANGIMTGVGNPSATVNFIRKRASTQDALAVVGTLGSWRNQRIQVDGNKALNENLAMRVVAVKQQQDAYLDRYSQDKNVLYTSVGYDIGDNTQLTFSHSFMSSSADGNNWGANPLYYTNGSATNYTRGTNTAADWSNWNVKRNESVLDLVHNINANWFVRASYTYKTTDEDSELFYVYGTPDETDDLGLFGYASEYDFDDKQTAFDIYLNGEFNWLGRSHQLVLGANHSHLDYQDVSLYDFTTGNGFPVMPALPQWDGNTPLPTFADGLTGSDVQRTQKSIYASARFMLSDDLHVLWGGRYNDYTAQGTSYSVLQDASDKVFIPYIGAVYQITQDLSAYASYTETFLSQTELDINNTILDPITGESTEIGVKHSLFDDMLIASFAYFDISQQNVAILDPSTQDLAPTEQRYMGAEGISSHGFEAELAGQVAENMQVSVGITDYTVNGDDTVARYTPSRIIKLALTYDTPLVAGLTIGTNLRWQGKTSRLQGQVAEGFANAGRDIITRQDSYALVSLMANYSINDKVSLSLNANNVFNEKYLNSLYWAQGYYGAPANYSASLTWQF